MVHPIRRHTVNQTEPSVMRDVAHEHEAVPRSKDAIEARRGENWKKLCHEHGGEAGARSALARTTKFQREFSAEAPYLGELMNRTAAAEDPRVLADCARYGTDGPPKAA